MSLITILKRTAAGFILTASLASAAASTFYVDSKFQGESPAGDSWLSAFPDLNSALEAAAANGGGEIWVRAGVYTPAGSSRDATFLLPENTALYGGFRGGGTHLAQRNSRANRTVLSGDIGRISSPSDNSYHVVTAASNTRLDGFTIQRGNADSIGENRFGGGSRLIPGSSRAAAANCTFEKNNAESGGAVHLSGGELSLSNCTFYSNTADAGGALAVQGDSRLTVQDCIFTSNFAPKRGGAVMLNKNAKAGITASSFLYNSTDDFGGAIAAQAEKEAGIELALKDCLFSENSARSSGGALGFSGPFTPSVKACRFEKNVSASGAGAVDNRNGAVTLLLDAYFAKNRGSKGMENIGNDESSRIIESAEEAARLAEQTRAAHAAAAAAPDPEPEAVVRTLPDVFVYNARSSSSVKLRSIVSGAPYSVLVFGDLTDQAFIKHYRTIEAAARDFHPKNVRFFYIYRHLKHPENNGYIKPFSIRERAQHTVVAKKQLQTAVPWLCDTMDNRAADELTAGSPNEIFIFASSGEEVFQGRLADKKALRKTLAGLVGNVNQPFDIATLPEPGLKPVNVIPASLVPRAKVDRKDQFQPLEITPKNSRSPFYVKARAEGSETLLRTGSGKLYLGLHIDPLFNVQWNNLGDPIKYTLKVPNGVVAPSINTAPRVTAAATDAEPREFILQARKLDINQPLQLQVTYSVHTSSKRNIEVTQQYLIYLSEDAFGGQVIGRQIAADNLASASEKNAGTNNAYRNLIRRFDLDRNGKLTEDEVIGRLQSNFDSIDTNNDGAIDSGEYQKYRSSR